MCVPTDTVCLSLPHSQQLTATLYVGERSLSVGSSRCVCVPTDTVCLSHPHQHQLRKLSTWGAIIVCGEHSLCVCVILLLV